eukprot:Sdes_comp19432_c0_seq1m10812
MKSKVYFDHFLKNPRVFWRRFCSLAHPSELSSAHSCPKLDFKSWNQVDSRLSKYLSMKNIVAPTKIQENVIPKLLAGNNVVIHSETGSGKTLAYVIPVIQLMLTRKQAPVSVGSRYRPVSPFCIVLVPNFDLSYQVANVFNDIFSSPALKSDSCLKAVHSSFKNSIQFGKESHIIVCTPACLVQYDLGKIFKDTRVLVLDEVDLLYDGNYEAQIEKIFRFIGPQKGPNLLEKPALDIQKIFVGATLPQYGRWTLKSKLEKSCRLSGLPGKKSLDFLSSANVHSMISTLKLTDIFFPGTNSSRQTEEPLIDLSKLTKLLKILRPDSPIQEFESLFAELPTPQILDDVYQINATPSLLPSASPKSQIIVFVKTSARVESLVRTLNCDPEDSEAPIMFPSIQSSLKYLTINAKDPYFHINRLELGPVASLTAKMSNLKRMKAMEDFKSGRSRILITTDLGSRGLDFLDVSAVVQFDLAENITTFLHRIGRTGRMNQLGTVYNFVTVKDENFSKMVRKSFNDGEFSEHFRVKLAQREKRKRQLLKKQALTDSLQSDQIQPDSTIATTFS